jgi:imidazolonepropionase-like amidohydrolase
MAALVSFFEEAQQYRRARPARRDLRLDAMLPVLEGKTPLFVTAVREREIREAIEFADRQKIRIILANAYECYKVIPLIKERDIPVVLGPTFRLPLDPDDPYDRSYTIPGELQRAGIRFAIATFSARQSRNLPYQAAAAVPFGLAHDDAYRAVSLSAAEIFGAGQRLGSIEEGKIADLIVTDGDPLEVTTKVNLVFIGGKPVSLETRQKQLYDKYSKRQ